MLGRRTNPNIGKGHSKRRVALVLMAICGLVGILVAAAAGGNAATAAQGTTVEIENAGLVVGGSSAVNIWVRGVPAGEFGLGACDISVLYDPAMIKVTGVSPGDAPFNAPIYQIGADHVGIAQFSTAWPGPVGDVRIARLEFTCLRAGTSYLVPEVRTLVNVNGDGIPAMVAKGIVSQTTGATPSSTATPMSAPTPTPTPTATPAPAPPTALPPTAAPTLPPTAPPTTVVTATPEPPISPGMPCRWYGTVTLNGASVSNGTAITATVEGDTYNTVTPAAYGPSTYAIKIVPPQNKRYTEGATVTFKIGGITAQQTGTWISSANVELNLTASTTATSASPSTPTPAQVPTFAPTPPPTSGPTPAPATPPISETASPTPTPQPLYVPDDYPTIQAAVNAASPGDAILVRDGTYTENVHVGKTLSIQSENGAERTIVGPANATNSVFYIEADSVALRGFTIGGAIGADPCGMSCSYPSCNSGLYLNSVTGCSVSNDRFFNNYIGVCLSDCQEIRVADNEFSFNSRGVNLEHSARNTIARNRFYYSGWEAYLADGGGSSINGSGISLFSSSNGNEIVNNVFSQNAHADVQSSSESADNIMYQNNFIDQKPFFRISFDEGTTGVLNSAGAVSYTYLGKTHTNYLGNYYSGYAGSDADGDGIGDVPYDINLDNPYKDPQYDRYPLMGPFENGEIGPVSASGPPALTTYRLTVQVKGSGSTAPEVGTHDYREGGRVEITAVPGNGWEFDGWSGDVIAPTSSTTCVVMFSSKTVVANFSKIGFPMTYVYAGASLFALVLAGSGSVGLIRYRRRKSAERQRIEKAKAEIVNMIEKATKGRGRDEG